KGRVRLFPSASRLSMLISTIGPQATPSISPRWARAASSDGTTTPTWKKDPTIAMARACHLCDIAVARCPHSGLGVDLREQFADDLGCLVRRQRIPTLGFGHLTGECRDRWVASHQYVAQRLGARIGILERLDRFGNVLGVLGNGMHDCHCLLAARGGRDRLAA